MAFTKSKEEFLRLMHYPSEWTELSMYPDDLFEHQRVGYEPGHERGSEHDRNGAFHWWLKRSPSKEQLRKLVLLSRADPDHGMGGDVRKYISRATNCDAEIRRMLRNR
jgi:hypothetical protein